MDAFNSRPLLYLTTHIIILSYFIVESGRHEILPTALEMLHSSQQKEYLKRLKDFIDSCSVQEKWKVVQYCVRKSVTRNWSMTNKITLFFRQAICMYTDTLADINKILYGGEADNKKIYQMGPYAVLLDGIICYKCEAPCDDKEVYRRTSSKLVKLKTICHHIDTHEIAYWSGFTSTYLLKGQEGVNDEIERSGSEYDLLFIINTKETYLKACYINKYSMYSDQHECLYPPATPIQYTSIRKYNEEADKKKHYDTSIKYIVNVVVGDSG